MSFTVAQLAPSRSPIIDDALPRELYEAYIADSSGLSWDGKPCPTWENLTDAVRQHWGAAAERSRALLLSPVAVSEKALANTGRRGWPRRAAR